MEQYSVVRIGSTLDKALRLGKKSASPLSSTFSAAETRRKRSKKPDMFRIATIVFGE